MINWMLEGDDVDCPVDDMKTLATDCSRFHGVSFKRGVLREEERRKESMDDADSTRESPQGTTGDLPRGSYDITALFPAEKYFTRAQCLLYILCTCIVQ